MMGKNLVLLSGFIGPIAPYVHALSRCDNSHYRPIAVYENWDWNVFFVWVAIAVLVFVLYVVIEYVIIYAVIRKNVSRKFELLKETVSINLQSFILTLFAMTALFSFSEAQYLALFIPFLIEPYLFRKAFNRLFTDGSVRQVDPEFIMLLVLGANVLSLIAGYPLGFGFPS